MRVLYIAARFPKLSESFIQAEIDQLIRLEAGTVGVATWRGDAAGGPGGQPSRGGFDQIRPARPSVRALVACFRAAAAIGCSTSGREFAVGVLRASWLLRNTKAWKPQIIHAHFVSLPAYVALILGRVLGVPVTVMPHARDYKVAVSPRALRKRLRWCSWIFPISGQALTEIQTICGPPHDVEGRVEVVRASWAAGAARVVVPRRSDDVTPYEIVTVARLVPKKGVDTAVRAVAELVRLGRPVHYSVIGAGPERPRLEQLAAQLGIADRVAFLGALPHDHVERIMARSDAALLLCRRAADGDMDGIPVSLMEAAALGLPVVSTNVGGIAELIEDGKSGLLCAPDDPVEAGRLLDELMKDPQLATARGENLQRHVLDEFDPRRQAERLQERWRSLVSP